MAGVALFSSLVVAILALGSGPFRRIAPLERWVLGASLATLWLGVLSLVSVRAGCYSPGLISGALLLSAAALRVRPFSDVVAGPLPESPTGGGAELTVLLVTLFALYALYPTYFILGGQDPGLYLLFASKIATSGSLDVDTAWSHRAWTDTHGALAPGYPGIYSLSEVGIFVTPNRLSPQFMHLFPALAANAWAAGGLEATVRVNAIFAVLALACGFVLVRRWTSYPTALAYVLALGLNPAFVWGARITLSEMVALWLNLLGVWLLALAAAKTSARWALLGGAVLGAGVLARFDSGLAGLLVLGLAVGAGASAERRRAARDGALAFVAVSALSFLDGRLFAPGYFVRMGQRHALGPLMLVSLGAGGAAVLWSWLPWRSWVRVPAAERVLPVATKLLWTLLLAWLGAALLGHPLWHRGPTDHAALELTWYVTPIAWPLFLLGSLVAIRSGNWSRWLPLLAFAGATTALYTARTDVAHEHIWASRRWLPHVIPTMLLFAAVGAHWLVTRFERRRRLAGLVAGGVLAAYSALCFRFERPFLFRKMLAGLPEAYAHFVSHIRASGARTPLVTTNVQLASILTYVYQVPTMLLGDKGYPRLAHGDLAGQFGVGFGAFDLGDATEYADWFHGPYPEITADRPPSSLIDLTVPLTLGRIGGAAYEVEVRANHPSLGTLVGRREADGSIHTTSRAGTLQNGPWLAMTPGQYEVDWLGRTWSVPKGKPSGTLDVIADGGKTVLAERPLWLEPRPEAESWLGGLEFTLERPLSGVEFRLRVEAETGIVMTGLRLRRVAVPSLEELTAAMPPPLVSH